MNRRGFLKKSATCMAIAAGGQMMGCSDANVGRRKETLRGLATKRGLLIGAAFANHAFRRDPEYGEILGREFNCLVGENNMKMDAVQSERGRFNFERADEMMEFAARHNMKVRAIPLAWHDGLPKWAEVLAIQGFFAGRMEAGDGRIDIWLERDGAGFQCARCGQIHLVAHDRHEVTVSWSRDFRWTRRA